ncbi:MAG: hypothetical protein NC122_07105 [Faecalibacterium sp.]|nr:hypothetical protein [Ruminococcus sp.]MCM1392253.1 hypothetical protein [Ruminococcus sp.]MCM1485959.1 hypothetical protein [Faecalibacterium sp.]
MSISEQILKLSESRNTIRTKLIELGLADSVAQLADLAIAISGILNRGAVNAQVREGESYSIPKGYHNGSGVVVGVAGGGNYQLQTPDAVTPTEEQQTVTPADGYYGLSAVTVKGIPSQYKDVSSVTVAAADVLANKITVDNTGKVIAGTMPNNGAVIQSLDASKTSYTIPKGYHDGKGTVSIQTETKSVTPTKSAQTVTPATGKLLSSVSVGAIPDEYVDTTDATATATDILADATAFANGEKVTGSIPRNGAMNKTIDGLTITSVVIPAGHTTGGTVSLTDDIENALAAI